MSNPRFRAVQIGRVAPGVWRVAVRGPLSARPYIVWCDLPTWDDAWSTGARLVLERYGWTL